ncbi:hypothetical protein FHW58_000414 [Duganella sp. 1224]|uniref:hypothetical protein n=1 Tax=Duganella sp. 1224 TaxID=2587052 RepID=UPI0015CAEDF5|nr:hypothetical protein [Duganella sp. 1224]NYE59262.1 hypothetical protein [Duganella sp. 1224]
MKSTVSVQVDADTMLRLISLLKVRGGAQDLAEALSSAVELWLREQSQLPFDCNPASVRGYQWKSLFLPEGTELRSWSYGACNHARVVGDEIIHKGKPVTPNQFAQSFARSMRNAWKDLSIRRPQDKQFKMAHRLRLEQAQAAPAGPPRPAPGAALADATACALLTAAPSQLPVSQPPVPAQPGPARPLPAGVGWDWPERRKFRFRLEDVAFD